MKRIGLVLTVLFLVCCLSSCYNNNEEPLRNGLAATRQATDAIAPKEDSEMLEGYKLNNLPLTEDDKTYSLQKLRDYFEDTDRLKTRSLDDINDMFPITHLRCVDRTEHAKATAVYSYYIVYPVTEGGTYIVFLQRLLDNSVTGLQHTIASESLYVNDLPHECDSLTIGVGSTYEEVLEIAPCTVISVSFSTGPRSYSLFCNGKVLTCNYSYGQNQELEVVEKTMIPLDESVFANMVLSDLQQSR